MLPLPASRRTAPHRPRIGVVKFASCDGCQLTLLDLEDELLAIAERVDIVEFAEATSRRSSGPFDILFVEGSVSTPEQADEIVRLRAAATTLVTIGASGEPNRTRASSSASFSAAGRLSEQWKGADTSSGTVRGAPRSLARAQATTTPRWVPAA